MIEKETLLTATPEDLAVLERRFQATIPNERKEMERLGVVTAQKLKAEGAQSIDGMGQKMCEIPARIIHRWQMALPGCWQDKQFVHEFLADNPQYCCPGWKPYLASPLRHGISLYSPNV